VWTMYFAAQSHFATGIVQSLQVVSIYWLDNPERCCGIRVPGDPVRFGLLNVGETSCIVCAAARERRLLVERSDSGQHNLWVKPALGDVWPRLCVESHDTQLCGIHPY
jgi:hypothetical protein